MPTASAAALAIPLESAGTEGDISFNVSTLVSSTSSIAIVVDTNAIRLTWPVTEAPSDVAIYVPMGRPEPRSAPWPPSWFSSVQAARTDTSERTEEILSNEFGRNGNR
jgi:hypothetical protein